MGIGNKIKELRQGCSLSQEELAERIYVSRNTISNWETEKSYPDVQSLLLLSVLFDVSVDELVKGDIQIMKNELDNYRLKLWSWVMLVCIVVGIVAIFPLVKIFGSAGIIPSAILIASAMGAAIVAERIKKKHGIQTYAEIVEFYEGNPSDPAKRPQKKPAGLTFAAKLVAGATAGIALSLLSLLIASLMG